LKKQNLIFDLDGTLIDSAESILRTIEAILIESGYKINTSINSDSIGPPLVEVLKNFTGETSDKVLSILVSCFKKKYDTELCITAKPYLGIEKLLNSLCALNKNLLLATNKRLTPTLRILDFLGWNHYFTGVYCIDSVRPNFLNKGTMIAALLLENKLLVSETIYLGDRLEDFAAATENNIGFGYVQWGYGGNQNHSKYDLDFHSAEEIIRTFQ
jgi:phosphoglycolate phosphatase